ncbi:MAG: PCMD domain-containing protein [Alistipes sp.]|nr:PCMD domain-containing protein [Alistipes sp.]
MMKRLSIILLSMAALTACIKNDIPAPTIDLYIETFEAEGTVGECAIDRSTRTVVIPLAEETNIHKVKITKVVYACETITNVDYEIDPSQIRVSKELTGAELDMSLPEYITLSYFQSYDWKIEAKQEIRREFAVDGQIGATEWDVERRTATAYRRNDLPLNNVTITALRFGPRPIYEYDEISEMDNNFDNPTNSQTITVTAHGDRDIWTLYVKPKEVAIDFEYVAAGTNVVWIKAGAIGGSDIRFAYRKKGGEWIDVPQAWYASDNNPYNRYEESFVKAVLRGLEPATEYEVIGYADGKESDIRTVTTGEAFTIPNNGFEDWVQLTANPEELLESKPGNCWYPFSSVQQMYWATGNPGSSIANKNITNYSLDVPAGSIGERSVYMRSEYVLGLKFAAGNIYVGYYGKTEGTDAYVYFGQPLEQNLRPVAVRLKVKYNCGPINKIKGVKDPVAGQIYKIGNRNIPIKASAPDLAKVFFCVTEWSEPHCVYSADEATFFDPRTAGGVLGVSYFDSDTKTSDIATRWLHDDEQGDTTKWHEMTIPVDYKNLNAESTMLVFTLTCSGYGDYFTGSTESWMYADDVELLFDLDESNMPR